MKGISVLLVTALVAAVTAGSQRCSHDGALLPHERCDKFYKCDGGIPVQQDCPTGLLYNEEKEWCDWPENVNCDRDNWGGGDNGNNSGGSCECTCGGGGEDDGDKGDDQFWPNGCPRDNTVYQLLEHETDNTRFYYCVGDGRTEERSCPPGLYFYFDLQNCVW